VYQPGFAIYITLGLRREAFCILITSPLAPPAMLYTDDFLETFSTDPISATKAACREALGALRNGTGWSPPELEAMEEADVLMRELESASILPAPYRPVQLDQNASRVERASSVVTALNELVAACEKLEVDARKEALATRIRIGLGTTFSYEFAPADLERVQKLLNELRDHVSQSTHFEPDHQRRILSRLESMQRELHKRVSDLDRFWGLVGEAGVVMAKLGNDAKPIVDRVREIADIVWNTQGRAEKLPSSAKPPQIGYESGEARDDAEA
jgi:hypothetical protein